MIGGRVCTAHAQHARRAFYRENLGKFRAISNILAYSDHTTPHNPMFAKAPENCIRIEHHLGRVVLPLEFHWPLDCRLASMILIHRAMCSFCGALSISSADNGGRDGVGSRTAALATWAQSC